MCRCNKKLHYYFAHYLYSITITLVLIKIAFFYADFQVIHCEELLKKRSGIRGHLEASHYLHWYSSLTHDNISWSPCQTTSVFNGPTVPLPLPKRRKI